MRIHELRRWHWIVIGALTGAALGGGRAAWGPAYLYSNARTLSQPLFERATLAPPGTSPRASDLVVHPPDETGACWVTGRYEQTVASLDDPPGPAVRSTEFKFRAPTPYKPGFAVDAADPARLTVADYLNQVAARVPQAALTYRYAWEEKPALGLLAWLAGATLLIGGVWPTLLRRLPGTPYPARPNEAAGPAPQRAASIPAPARTWRESARPESEAELEACLAALNGGNAETFPVVAVPSPANHIGAENLRSVSAPVVRLATVSLEPMATPAVQDHKEYGGEYYPTVVHGKEPHVGHEQHGEPA